MTGLMSSTGINQHGCQLVTAELEGLWLRYATLQNLITSIQGEEGIKFCHLATLIIKYRVDHCQLRFYFQSRRPKDDKSNLRFAYGNVFRAEQDTVLRHMNHMARNMRQGGMYK